MSDEPLYTQRIVWPGSASSSVICTGEFDNWQGTQMLAKGREDGIWAAEVKVPYGQREVKYKFVVDGTWQHADSERKTEDDSGNVNNVFSVPASLPRAAEAAAMSEPEPSKPAAAQTSSGDAGDASDEVAIEPPSSSSAAPNNDAVEEISSNAVESQDQSEQSEQSEQIQRDLPQTLQDLLGGGNDDPSQMQIFNGQNPNSSNGNGSNGSSSQQMPFQTISVSAFANIRHLNSTVRSYPSPFLLQVEAPTDSITPTDVQIACEYLIIRQRALTTSRQSGVENPEPLGILKIFAKMRENYPTWVVSEKRLRKIVKDGEGGRGEAMLEAERITKLAGLVGSGKGGNELIPVSRMDKRLVADLEGTPYPASSSAGAAAKSAVNGEQHAEEADKENALPTTSQTPSKKKGKKSKAATSTSEDPIWDSLPSLADKVASAASSVLPAAVTNAVSSAPVNPETPKGPTNIQGDVGVKWFDDVKGRGIITKKAVKKGNVIFREEAFAYAPTKTIQQAINDGQGCTFCGKLFLGKASSLVVPCTSHDSVTSASSSSASSTGSPFGTLTPTTGGQRKVSGGGAKKSKPGSSGNAIAKKDQEVAKVEGEETKSNNEPSCKNKFCSKACREKCNETYANLLCPIVNPSYAALLQWAEHMDSKNGRQNPMGVFKILLRLVVACQRDGLPSKDGSETRETGLDLLERVESLAAVNERSRKQKEFTMFGDLQYGQDWLHGYRLIMEALQLPLKYYEPHPLSTSEGDDDEDDSSENENDDGEKPPKKDFSNFPNQPDNPAPPKPGKTLQKPPKGAIIPEWYKKDLAPELADKILGFDNFLVWWGRVALNQEDDGGIYILHPCTNHDCDPNAIVKRTASISNVGAREAKPSKIFVVAMRDIAEGEELTIAYVSPSAPVEHRRAALSKHYLFDCFCAQCERQSAAKGTPLRHKEIEDVPSSTTAADDEENKESSPIIPTPKKKSKKSAGSKANGKMKKKVEEGKEKKGPLTLEEKAEEMFGKKGMEEKSAPWYEDIDD